MNRSWSPQTVRIWPGQLSLMHKTPSASVSCSSAPVVGSKITGWIPKNGSVQEPGLVLVAPGKGVIKWPPVSVCHHVSTMGALPLPTTSLYQFQASGLIGSPTVPSTLIDDRSYFSTKALPWPIRARIAVGAV